MASLPSRSQCCRERPCNFYNNHKALRPEKGDESDASGGGDPVEAASFLGYHMMMAIISMYMAMLLTDWSSQPYMYNGVPATRLDAARGCLSRFAWPALARGVWTAPYLWAACSWRPPKSSKPYSLLPAAGDIQMPAANGATGARSPAPRRRRAAEGCDSCRGVHGGRAPAACGSEVRPSPASRSVCSEPPAASEKKVHRPPGSEAVVNGKNIGSCLGDLFSTNWMEDTDAAIQSKSMGSETLSTQYDTVKTETTRSPVLKFGDFSFNDEAIGEFEGVVEASTDDLWIQSWLNRGAALFESEPQRASAEHVDQRDHMLHYLSNKVMTEGGDDNHAALLEEVTLRSFYDNTFQAAFPGLLLEELETELEDYDCYRFLIDSFEQSCGKFNDYGFKYARYLRHTCIVGDAELVGSTAQTIHNLCSGAQ